MFLKLQDPAMLNSTLPISSNPIPQVSQITVLPGNTTMEAPVASIMLYISEFHQWVKRHDGAASLVVEMFCCRENKAKK